MFRFLFLIILLLTPLKVSGDNRGWDFAGWYGGGFYSNIIPDPNIQGRIYLTSDVAGLWRSDDRGDHWYSISKGVDTLNIPLLAVAPSDSNIIYLGETSGMMKSSDAGQTWKALSAAKKQITFSRPGNYRSILISKEDPKKLYAGSSQGNVYFSIDGGETWKQLGNMPFGSKTPITSVQTNEDETELFVSSKLGLMKFNVKSHQWVSLLKTSESIPVLDMVISGGNLFAAYGSKLAYSPDLGDHWQYSNEIAKGRIKRIDVSKNGNEVLIGWQDGYKGGLLLTNDFGAHWEKAIGSISYDEKLNHTRQWMKGMQSEGGVRFDPFNSKIMYTTDMWGVYRSDDAGHSWHEKINGAPNTSGSDILVSKNGDLLVATMDNGLSISNDFGQSYKPLIPGNGINGGGHIWRVLSLENNSTQTIATGFMWNEQINQVFVQKKGESIFHKIKEGLPTKNPRTNTLWGTGYARALAADPFNQNRLYLGIDGDDGGGLFISDDGGFHWKRSEGQPDSLKIYNALIVNPVHSNEIFWGACPGGVYKSDDSGKTWKQSLKSLGCVFDLAVSKDGTLYAAGSDKGAVLFTSYNSGQSWSRIAKFDKGTSAEAIAVDPSNNKRIFAGAVNWNEGNGGTVYYSSNGGNSWKDIGEQLPSSEGPAAITIDNKDNLVYIILYAGSVYKRRLDSLE